MNVENTLKKKDLNARGFFALIHDETGRIYATTAVDIHKELSALMEQLKAGKCPHVQLQRYYKQSPDFQVLTQVTTDGMRGAKKAYLGFRSATSSYLFLNSPVDRN